MVPDNHDPMRVPCLPGKQAATRREDRGRHATNINDCDRYRKTSPVAVSRGYNELFFARLLIQELRPTTAVNIMSISRVLTSSIRLAAAAAGGGSMTIEQVYLFQL